jgi:putative endonuclease
MPKELGGHVYIMCNINNTTLYTGVTSNLPARVAQHKEKAYPNSFSAKYNCTKLVYYKWFDTIIEAIAEEKRIKGGSRKKKEILINSINPQWNDLYQETRFR